MNTHKQNTVILMHNYKPIMKRTLLLLLPLLLQLSLKAQDVKTINIQVDKPTVKIQPTMWGVFFEDINFAADGGLYAELVKNRSFEFSKPLMGWKEVRANGGNGNSLIINRGNENANNPRFDRVTVKTDEGYYALVNEGFRGMGIEKGKTYNFSFLARKISGNIKVHVILLSADGKTFLGDASLEGF